MPSSDSLAGLRRSFVVPHTHWDRGLTVINARQVLNRDGRLIVSVPETVEASADDLAPALQAA